METTSTKPVGVPTGLLKTAKTVDLAPAIAKTAKTLKAPNPIPVSVSSTVPVTAGHTITIPMALAARLLTPTSGQGGYQSLVAVLRSGITIDGDNGVATITVAPDTLTRLLSYAVKYGGGGYQSAFRWLVCLLAQAVGAF